ncbi:hypothetical protein L6164_036996 [Bauhinia variegata]|uniref:Uncharacterized protein n=1 Tax=Bauhinia variegata TaxID=167791 RepID=A0ACB9KIS8_BAUVA|nr:hypothetical protein L6164_036996 [Bauhinia variegata]
MTEISGLEEARSNRVKQAIILSWPVFVLYIFFFLPSSNSSAQSVPIPKSNQISNSNPKLPRQVIPSLRSSLSYRNSASLFLRSRVSLGKSTNHRLQLGEDRFSSLSQAACSLFRES